MNSLNSIKTSIT